MGFRRLELGVADNPSELSGWIDAHRETGITAESVVVGALYPKKQSISGSFLGSLDEERRDRAINSARRHLTIAQTIGAPVVVVRGCALEDPSMATEARRLLDALGAAPAHEQDRHRRDVRALVNSTQERGVRHLEQYCRSLHSLKKLFPETRLAVEPGYTFNDLLSLQTMRWVMDDLARDGIGYWHDTGRLHRRQLAGLPGPGEWLDAFASRMDGIHLSDATHSEDGLPPGMGEVDFRLVAEYLPRNACRVIEADPVHGRAEILAAISFLLGVGI